MELGASGSSHLTNPHVLFIVPLRSKLQQPDAPEGSEAMTCLSLALEYRCSDAQRSGLGEDVALDSRHLLASDTKHNKFLDDCDDSPSPNKTYYFQRSLDGLWFHFVDEQLEAGTDTRQLSSKQ